MLDQPLAVAEAGGPEHAQSVTLTTTTVARTRNRYRYHGLIAGSLIALFVLAILIPHHTAQAAFPSLSAGAVPGQLIISFLPSTPPAARDGIIRAHGGTIVDRITRLDAVVATFPAHVELQELDERQRLMFRLGQEQAVVDVEPNLIYRLAAVPNDPLQGQQWAWSTIDAADA